VDRKTSLRILGLPPSATDDEARAAWWALRAHVDARALSARTPEEHELRDRELRELNEIWSQLGIDAQGAIAQRNRRWGQAAAAVLGLAVALGGIALWRTPDTGPWVEASGGAVAGGGGEENTVSEEDRARLVARSEIADAQLDVRDATTGESVVAGPADDTAYWLAPGDYRLRVSHPDCEQSWEQEFSARAGEEYAPLPELCGETAWLVVEANVDGAQVIVDDREVGASGPARHPVEPGERGVRVEREGFDPWEGIAELTAGSALTLRPKLEESAVPVPADEAPAASASPSPPPPPPSQSGSGAPQERDSEQEAADAASMAGWHHETRQWILARYDHDLSGSVDSASEVEAVSCDYWRSIERSYDASGLGVPLLRLYGFDGSGWKAESLGVSSSVRDLAFRRLRDCGLRY